MKLLRGLWGLFYGVLAGLVACLMWPYFAIKNNSNPIAAAFTMGFFIWALPVSFGISLYQTIRTSLNSGFAASLSQPFKVFNLLSNFSNLFNAMFGNYYFLNRLNPEPPLENWDDLIPKRNKEIQENAKKQAAEIQGSLSRLPKDLLPIIVGYATEIPEIDDIERAIQDKNRGIAREEQVFELAMEGLGVKTKASL